MMAQNDSKEKVGNLTSRITNELGRAIISGKYAIQAFPIEAEISEQFDASRSVTREAIKMLTAKGLIVSRSRHGTSVADEVKWNFLDSDVLRWILERGFSLDLLAEFTAFRSGIEPQAAAIASRRGNVREFTAIIAALDSMDEAEANGGDMLQADIDFHVAILEASGNRFMIQCRDLVATALKFSIQMTNLEKGVRGADVEAHRVIASAIIAGDSQRALSASQDLLQEAAILIERARRAAD